MGESTKIVVERYPVDKLPEDLRKGLESGKLVRITVEPEEPSRSGRLSDLLKAGPGIYSSPEEAAAALRALRAEWE